MTREEIYEYLDLINKLRKISNRIDNLVNRIDRYEIRINRGFILNDSISFKDNLKDLKENLIYKKNKIRNDIIPELYSCLNNL